MSGLLSVIGFLGLVAALVGLCKGSLRTLGLRSRAQCGWAAGASFAVLLVGGALAPDPVPVDAPAPAAIAVATPEPAASPSPAPTPAPSHAAPSAVTAAPAPPVTEPSPAAPAREALLVMAAGGDGDSWRDTSGVEYRMGLINAPEIAECGGAAATSYRQRALAGGFRAVVYSVDDFGRSVAVVHAPNGVNLNVAMARDGIADDRYLERFRHENPSLAAQLDDAFREARSARRGIWGTCGAQADDDGAAAPPPQPAAGGRCHPDYATCIPIVGDGSGRGAANDLDCGDVDSPVHLREVGRDPYRLDGSDRDGVGCE